MSKTALPKTVLLCEDEVLLARLFERSLKRLGMTVHLAFDGEEALRLVDKQIFDIAIIDVHLPIIEGISVLRKIQATQPACISIITSGDLDSVYTELQENPPTYRLAKPFRIEKLLQLVNSTL